MCEVMPTINEGDPLGPPHGADADANFEQLMVNMLDEREDTCEFLGLQGDPTSQCSRKSVLNIYWKD